MILVVGKYLSSEQREKNGFKYLEVAVDNELSPRYPHLIQCDPNLKVEKLINKDGIISVPNIYVKAWDTQVKKFSPKGVKLSYSDKS